MNYRLCINTFIISADAFEDGAGPPEPGAGPPQPGAGPRQPPRAGPRQPRRAGPRQPRRARRREIDFLAPRLTSRVTRSNDRGGSHSKNCLFFEIFIFLIYLNFCKMF